MSTDDIFSKSEDVNKEKKDVKKETKLAKKKRVLNKGDAPKTMIREFGDQEFGEIVVVTLDQSQSSSGQSSSRAKVKYSLSPEANRRLFLAIDYLKKISYHSKELGVTKSEFERCVLNPILKVIRSGYKDKKNKGVKGAGNADTVKLNSFQSPRKAKDEFEKLYRKLEEGGNDMSSISYDNGFVSLLDSARTVRMYFNVYKLRDDDTKHLVLDDFLKDLFGSNIKELCSVNGGEFVTQRQVQTLASWLVNKLNKMNKTETD